ncbi:4'-phosphopantetheinyl transferase family protein [Bacillus thuringiensis]|uniref:4'-phosphopantetheinyl transferase family protein n=1 Tax=Bacillus thuringiensis TaxID=1428 RepID=UPI000A3B7358|nr:4'-phosphopantetheinyl transferase superfamily protein [Bacillus thuringiensis]OUA56147.1 hypothetical protein BK781_20015 [Bacillus thuringiensis serovar aizawai]
MNMYIVKIPNQLTHLEFYHYINKISKEKQVKVMNYVRKEDTIGTIFGELLIRAVIQKEYGIKSNLLSFSYNQYGKPYIRELPGFHYNISHSGNRVVCVTDSKPIGIDIELIKPINLQIAQRFFTKEEYEFLTNQSHNDQLSCFYDFWTLKESFIKAIGRGLTVPLNSFNINMKNNNEISLDCNFISESFWFNQYEIHPKYKIAVCSMKEIVSTQITHISYSSL